MRFLRHSLVRGLVRIAALGLFASAVACGGGNAPAAAPTSPSSESASPGSGASAAGDPSATQPGAGGSSGPGTTTTTALGQGSDLQGAKLGSSSRTEVETKAEGGPKSPPGGKSDEPGRRRDDIRALVQARRDEARACYDKALKEHPTLEGDLVVTWTIDPQGGVSDVAVDSMKSQIHEESVGKCVGEVIKKIKFNASAKGFETHASYPFNFHPKNPPPKTGAK